jgi:hypothetical protein
MSFALWRTSRKSAGRAPPPMAAAAAGRPPAAVALLSERASPKTGSHFSAPALALVVVQFGETVPLP